MHVLGSKVTEMEGGGLKINEFFQVVELAQGGYITTGAFPSIFQ